MTMLPPDAVDDVDGSALVIEAEMATEIVNRAGAMVQRRIAQLMEEGDAAEANRLRATAAKPLFALLRSIDDRNEAHVQAIIATWGSRVMDEAVLWAALTAHGPTVVISGADLRPFHPADGRLPRTASLEAAHATAPDTRRWVEMLIAE